MESFHRLDTLVLIGYFVLMFLMGVYFSRRNRTTEDYFLGGRQFKGWVIGLSLVGTSISSITFLAYPGDAFKTNWLRFLPNLMLPLAIVVAAYHFLPRLRQGNAVTAYEFLEKRFGAPVRAYGALAFTVAQVARISMILYLISLVIRTITRVPADYAVILAGVFVALYTIIGGIKAVVWTDVIQTLVLLTGGIACGILILSALPGGVVTLWEAAWNAGKFSVGADVSTPADWGLSLTEKTATMMLCIGLINWLTEYSSNQNTVQRFCATANESEARKAMFICALVSVPTWAFFMFLGTGLFVYFNHFPADTAAEILAGTRKAEEILPYFIMSSLAPGMVGLVMAAAIAAAMSSLDSSINAIAAVLTSDIYRRFISRGRDDRVYLRVARGISVALGIVMIVGALYLVEASTNTLQDTATIVTALFAGGLLTIYLIGFFSRRCDTRHIMLGVAATMGFTTWSITSGSGTAYPFDLYYTGLLGNLVMFVVAYGSSYLLPSPAFALQSRNS